MAATELTEGKRAPAFSLPDDGGRLVRLRDFAGRALVIYFYPKDATSGCSREACDFRDGFAAFAARDVAVLGVSCDDAASHAKFRAKLSLPFPLLVDAEAKVATAYGAWQQKSMYGRKFMGIERTTVLVGGDGKVRKIWRKVRVPGHVAAVLEAL